jgi:hypothetical protein
MSTTKEAATTAAPTANGAIPDSAPVCNSAADFIAKRKAKPQKHYVASAGEWMWFLPLSAGRRRDLDRLQVKEKATFNPETKKDDIEYVYDPVGHQLAMVMLGWTNDKGDRLKGQAGLDLIGQLPDEVVKEAYGIVSKISGYGEKVAEKNSDANRGGNGSSSSR